VSPTGEEAGLGGGRPTLDAEDAGDIDTLASEICDERFSGGVVSDSTNGEDARAEGCKVVSGVGAAARSEMRFAMPQDQDWRFARNARNLAKLIFISDKIAKENDRLRRELLNVVRKGQEIDAR
jgi:hypothetical protein